MKRTARILLIAVSSIAVLYTAYLFTRPNPIDMLVERGVPVPLNAVATNSNYGGLFAKYLFVRTELTPDQLVDYRTSLPTAIQLNVDGGMKIVSTDLTNDEMMSLIESETEMRFKHGPPLHWWNIDLIENGTYHHKELENACGYEIFIDNDSSTVFIYWHYS